MGEGEGQTLESRAIDKLAHQYGGKSGLAELLLTQEAPAPGSPLDKVLALILDPVNEGKSLGLLCRQAGVSMNTVMKAIQAGHGAKAIADSMRAVYGKVAEVAEDLVARAAPQEIPCRHCSGVGQILVKGVDEPKECPYCAGKGRSYTKPDLDRQKFALELGGVYTKKHQGGGVRVSVPVSVNQKMSVRSDATSLFDLVKAASMRTVYGLDERALPEGKARELAAPKSPETVIDAQVVEKSKGPMPAMARPAWKRPE